MTPDFSRKMFLWSYYHGPTEYQLKKVKKLGLYDYVGPKRVIVSQQTGFQKLEKEIFTRS